MKWWSVLLLTSALSFLGVDIFAQPTSKHHAGSDRGSLSHGSAQEQGEGQWEGSAQGVAYSEFNHRFAGLFVLLFGLAELGHALRYQLPIWTRMVLPSALAVLGTYLLIWSDHAAWPVGPLSFVQTFSGQDPEIIQHKFYGVFGATAAVSETIRRVGLGRHPAWAAPLVFLAIVGAVLLFVHSHGDHPANHTITVRHMVLGCFGVGAAVSSAMVAWVSGSVPHMAKRWELAWAMFIIVIGVQLLLYFE